MTITVLLVSDHSVVRDRLQSLLRSHSGLELISKSDVAAAHCLLQRREVDVIVLDSQLPTVNGINTAECITGGSATPPLILLTLQSDARYVKASFGKGVAGYLLRDAAYEELPEAIRVVAGGKCYLSPAIAEAMSEEISDNICH